MTVPVINQGSLALATPNADPFSNIAGSNLAQRSQTTRYNPATGGPRALTPDQIPGLQLWLDASQPMFTASYAAQVTAAGDQIGLWPDRSGNARLGTASATKPTYDPVGMNGRPTINFNGNSTFSTPSFLDATFNNGITVFMVHKAQSGAGNKVSSGATGINFQVNDSAKTFSPAVAGLTGAPTVNTYVNSSGIAAYRFNGSGHTTQYDRLFDPTTGSAGNASASQNVRTGAGVLALSGAITIGDLPGGGFTWPGQKSEEIWYNRALTNEEFRAIYDYLAAKWGCYSKKFVLCAGNSLTSGTNSTGGAAQITSATGTNYPSQLWAALGTSGYDVATDAYPGRTLTQMLAETPLYGDMLYLPTASASCVEVVWEVTNELGTYLSGRDAYDKLVRYCKARRAQGFSVVVATCLPRNDAPYAGFEKERVIVNALIRANYSTFADGLADVAADARLQTTTNTTYFGADQVHLTDVGYGVVASIVSPAVQAAAALGATAALAYQTVVDGGRVDNTPIGRNGAADATVTTVTATSAVTAAGAVRGAITNTANATVGNATLTAASMVGGVITRSGPVGAYADTTATAAALIAAIPNAQIGTCFDLTIINTVAFANTLAAGTGVTLAGTTAISASTWRRYVGSITAIATPAVTLTGIGSGTL